MNADDASENQKAADQVAPPVKATQAEPHTQASQRTQPPSGNIREWWKDKGFTRTLEVTIAFATVVSATVAYYQWEAMKRSNVEAKKSADAAVAAVKQSGEQFRALFAEEYVPKIVATGIKADVTDSYVLAKVQFENVGKTAATDAFISGTVAIVDPTYDIATWQGVPATLEATIGPGEAATLTVDSRRTYTLRSNRITPQDLALLTRPPPPIGPPPTDWSQHKTLQVFGYVHPGYDPIKVRRVHVWFCYTYYAHSSSSGDWGPCGLHNRLEWDKNAFEQMTSNPSDKRPTVPYAPDFVPSTDRP